MRPIEIAREAVKLTWRFKTLWFFGFFVAGAGGGNGGTGFKYNLGDGEAAGSGIASLPVWFLPLLGAAMVIGLVFLVLHILSEGALIEGLREARAGRRLAIGEGLRRGREPFWRLLAIKLLAFAVFFVTVGLIALPALLAVLGALPWYAGAAGTLLLLLPAIPWLLTVYFVYNYAMRFAVLERRGPLAAIAAGKLFLHGRLADSLLLLVFVLAGHLAAGLTLGVLLVPVIVLGLGLYFALGLMPALVVGAVYALPFACALAGALGTYRSALWTISFDEGRALGAA